MDTTFIISIISSVTAVLSVTISIIFNSRNQKKSAVELEKLKLYLGEEKVNREEIRKERLSVPESVDKALEMSQKLKDLISILMGTVPFEKFTTSESYTRILGR